MPPKHKSGRVKEQNRNQLKAGDYALIVTQDNDVEFLMPLKNEEDATKPVPKHAFALIAFANRLEDDIWVSNFVEDFFSEYESKDKNN